MNSLGNEMHTFSDGQGYTIFKFDNNNCSGLQVTPEHEGIIIEEIEKEWAETRIDVECIHKLLPI